MSKYIGFASELNVTSTTGTLIIGQIRSISGPNSEAADVDTTTLDSSTNYRTFIPGLIDPGAVTFDVIFDPTTTAMKRLNDYHDGRLVKTFAVTHPTTTVTQSFSAYVKSLGQEIPLDDVVTRPVTLKVTGDPGWTS